MFAVRWTGSRISNFASCGGVAALAIAGTVALAGSWGCTADNPEFIDDGGAGVGVDLQGTVVGHPDLAVKLPPGGWSPSHVSPDYFDKGSADLVVTSSIDTGTHTLDGKPAPAGVLFVDDGKLAVLAVRSLTVPGGARVSVRGPRPLVVVAGATIAIAGLLDAAARQEVPGPGGKHPSEGAGHGSDGSGSPLDCGGSGAGASAAGGIAGSVDGPNCGQNPTPANPGGLAFGDGAISDFVGGSGGGNGSLGGRGCPLGSSSSGGAGGGAVQLTARASVTIGGQIQVGGGGGHGGCQNPAQKDSGSGGGGGSGGAILVEAPTLVLGGSLLVANGGGGGGGAFATAGGSGVDGQLSSTPAPGGSGGRDFPPGNKEVVDQRGGSGGTSGAGGASVGLRNCGNSGGGGGAAGRIHLRSHDPASATGASFSPPATSATF